MNHSAHIEFVMLTPQNRLFCTLLIAAVAWLCGVGGVDASDRDERLLLISPEDEARFFSYAHIRPCEERLFLTSGEIARYLCVPAFREPEFAVSIYKNSETPPGMPGGYWVTATKAARRLRDVVSGGSKRPTRDPRRIRVIRHDAPLPEAAAKAVHKVWLEALSHARKRTRLEIEGDSDIIVFSTRMNGRELRGELYGLGRMPRGMIHLGEALVAYAAAPPEERIRSAAWIREQALRLLE